MAICVFGIVWGGSSVAAQKASEGGYVAYFGPGYYTANITDYDGNHLE